MAELITLKPCPFCGSDPSVRYTLGRPVIECNNRKCSIQPSTWLRVNTDSMRKLVSAWNTRKEEVD